MYATSKLMSPHDSIRPTYTTLPISEIATGARRLEADVYLSDGFTLRRQILRSKLQVSPLGALADIWQPSRLKGIRVGHQHGVPFLAATQFLTSGPRLGSGYRPVGHQVSTAAMSNPAVFWLHVPAPLVQQ